MPSLTDPLLTKESIYKSNTSASQEIPAICYYYYLQLGCRPVAVVILHAYKT